MKNFTWTEVKKKHESKKVVEKINNYITIFGCGNCFTPEQVNTSFLVTRDKNIYLIDCGYNVFQELMTTYPEVIKNLFSVWITHLHPDHVGSLGALILYRYFIYNKKTVIFVGKDLEKDLDQYLRMTTSCSRKIDESSSSFLDLEDTKNLYIINPPWDLSREIVFIPVLHGPTTAYGIWVSWNKSFFTGDTYLIPKSNQFLEEANFIFHDCFVYDDMNLIHSPYDAIMKYYPKEILEKIVFVHHGLLYSQYSKNQYRGKFGISGMEINCDIKV